jgi:hypothetical protein
LKERAKKTHLESEIYVYENQKNWPTSEVLQKEANWFVKREREIGGERRVTRYIRGERLGF